MHHGTAADNSVKAQDLGMVIFLAVVNCVYHNLAMRKVSQVLPEMDAAEIKDLIAGTSSRTYKALSEDIKGRVTPQITDAMSYVWLFFSSCCYVQLLAFAAVGGELRSRLSALRIG
jgi:hypothetical protein